MMIKEAVRKLFDEQLTGWELAATNYNALCRVKTKTVRVEGRTYKVQYNPARIVSSSAKVDSGSIRKRKCFLCPANLPPVQRGIMFKERYTILVNPFPVFPRHLTIPDAEHVDQRILHRFGDMLDLAVALDDYVIFYNGPECGASAPDHLHFQAGSKGFLPLECEWRNRIADKVIVYKEAVLWYPAKPDWFVLVIESGKKEDAIVLFNTIYDSLERKPGGSEPLMNVVLWYEHGKWIIAVFPREQHRPSCYTAQGDENMLISPASVDMGGVFITPLEKDFERITAGDIRTILNEVCISPEKLYKVSQQIKERL